MKTVLFFSLFTAASHAGEVYNYRCHFDSDHSIELSVLDENKPNLSLFYKKSKYGSCGLSTIEHNKRDSRAVINEASWSFKLDACTYYIEKHKDKIKLLNTLTFKDSGTKGRFLTAVPQKDALFCEALK